MEGSQAPDDPAVQLLDELLAESDAEVVEPTGYEAVEFVYDALQRYAAGAAGDFP